MLHVVKFAEEAEKKNGNNFSQRKPWQQTSPWDIFKVEGSTGTTGVRTFKI